MKSDPVVAGAWHQIKGKVKEQWGKLTEDDLKELEGHAEQLAGKLQERYGLLHKEAERQVQEFRKRINWH
ncbi:MAG TPA: CsbD family protein [Steroidobacteraceae bacterium]|nr:CsbD family protein [Steroidobacteraceae bacterium]